MYFVLALLINISVIFLLNMISKNKSSELKLIAKAWTFLVIFATKKYERTDYVKRVTRHYIRYKECKYTVKSQWKKFNDWKYV